MLVAQLCLTLCHPWTVTHQVPLSMEFSRQEYWTGLPFPSPGDLPHPGINLHLLHCRQTLYHLSHQGRRHLICKSRLFGKGPDPGKDWRQKEKGWWRMRWLNSITNSMDMNLSKLQQTVEDRGAWHAAVHGASKSQTRLSNWAAAVSIGSAVLQI